MFLAKALIASGLHFSFIRIYDEPYLQEVKCQTIKEAEREDKKKKPLPGNVTWFFEPCDSLNRLLVVFNQENKSVDELIQAGEPIPFCEEQDADVKCREFVRAMRGSKLIDKTLFSSVPYIRIWEDGKGKPVIKDTSNGKLASWPACKVISANANEEVRKHLGL